MGSQYLVGDSLGSRLMHIHEQWAVPLPFHAFGWQLSAGSTPDLGAVTGSWHWETVSDTDQHSLAQTQQRGQPGSVITWSATEAEEN